MKSTFLVSLAVALSQGGLLLAAQSDAEGRPARGEYTLVVEGYDWGAGASRAILSLDETVSSANAADFTVTVRRNTDCIDLAPEQASGERVVIDAYVSDAQGRRRKEGTHVTLVLGVAPQWPLVSPLQYVRSEKCRGNQWVEYRLTVTSEASGRVWDTEAGRIRPLVDRFDLSGRFVHDTGTTLSYASFAPATSNEKPRF